MRTLYLHIGAHRTATSSIQSFLHANSAALQERGIFYPFGVKRHDKLVRDLFAGRTKVADVAAEIERRASGRTTEVKSIILSDEDISLHEDISILGGFRDLFDVKVIYSLRRQDLWLESWYLQNVKWQWNPKLAHVTLDEFVEGRNEFHWVDYDTYLQHLERVFGRENVIAYVFEKEQMPAGPIAKFAEVAGIGSIDGLTDPPHDNSSRLAVVSEFMRQLPLDKAPPAYRARLETACAKIDAQLRKGAADRSQLLFDAGTRAKILDEHAAGNAAVARRYFGRDALFLAPVPAADAPVAKLALPEDSSALMTGFVAPMIAALIEDYRLGLKGESESAGGAAGAGRKTQGRGKPGKGPGKGPGAKGPGPGGPGGPGARRPGGGRGPAGGRGPGGRRAAPAGEAT